MGDPEERERKEEGLRLSRRGFLGVSGAAVGVLALPTAAQEKALAESGIKAKVIGPAAVPISLKVNGKSYNIKVDTDTTLLSALRDHLQLTGTKPACGRGACGACTVHVSGKPMCSCMMLAVDAADQDILTIEGLAKGQVLHPIQAAFVEFDALQCGFCTPGMIMAVKALLDANPEPSDEEIREAVAGNVCRCGTYPRVFQAARAAARRMKSARVLPEGGRL
ncbi:(2Fe-2S)-binding protein [bacterium]|nr:(2Fe-2S)-binding protein [bacterium]